MSIALKSLRALAISLICFGLISCDGGGNSGPNSPNILLVIADDLGLDATPGYEIGELKPNMPNLAQLAENGVIFDNVWAAPQCCPTRATILTGRYGFRTNVLNSTSLKQISLNETSLFQYINAESDNDYANAVIGKWHLSGEDNGGADNPNLMGVDHYSGIIEGGHDDYYNWSWTENGVTQTFDGYATTKFTDLAIEWIEQQDTPWILWLAYTAPHAPLHAPPAHMHSQGELSSDPEDIEANPMPYFLAMVETIDFEMGRLMAQISDDVLAKTIIIFVGDNGTSREVIQQPYETTQGKNSLYQGGIHVPMIVGGDLIQRKGEREQNLINSTDLFATIAEFAGVESKQIHDSYSFADLLSGDAGNVREYIYTEIEADALPSGWTIRDDRFKLIEFRLGNTEFYNLQDDPYEKNDLALGELSDEEAEAMAALAEKANQLRMSVDE